MPSQLPDELHDRLSGLRADLDGVPMADAHAVRRRGDRRTRHQAVGTAVASVAAIGLVGTLALSALGEERGSSRPVPGTPTVTATDVATPAPALHGALAADPLLTGADLGPFPVYGVLLDSPEAPDVPPMCAPDPAGLGAAQVAQRLYYSDLDATGSEWVLRFDSAAAAERATSQLAEGSVGGDCARDTTGEDFVTTPAGPAAVEAGDEAYRTSLAMVPAPGVGSELSYQEMVVGRDANVVTVLYWRSQGSPREDGGSVLSAEQLARALDAAVD
jgi:hypothetical protein